MTEQAPVSSIPTREGRVAALRSWWQESLAATAVAGTPEALAPKE